MAYFLKEKILIVTNQKKELIDVDYAYQLYRYDTERQFHFHQYSGGKVAYKKKYKHLYLITNLN